MDIVLLNLFLITVFVKGPLSFELLGLNFAPWDVFLLYPIIQRRLYHRFHMRWIHSTLFLFLIVALFSTLANLSANFSFIGLILQILRNIFLMDLFFRLGEKFYQRRLVNTFTIWGFFIPIAHLAGYYSPMQSAITEPSIGNFMRLEGFVGDANFFAFSVLLLTLAVTRFRILILFLVLPCILLTGSRSGLGLWCILFYLFFRNYRLYIFLIIFSCAVLFKNAVLVRVREYEELFAIFSRSLTDFSRFRYWIEAYSRFDGQYLFGNGVKSFVFDIGNFSHNDFITAFYEYGILGLISFTLIVISLLRLPSPKRLAKQIDLQFLYFSLFILLNLFSFWLYPHLWILQGALLGATYSKIMPPLSVDRLTVVR